MRTPIPPGGAKRRRAPAFPRQSGPYPRLLAAALLALYEGVPGPAGRSHQVGTIRLAEAISANPRILRRELAKPHGLVASWRRRRSRVWRLTARGKACAAALADGADIRDWF